MGLQYQVDSLEGLDDSVKALYTEKDGKYVLGVEGLPQPQNADLDGLKARVQELLNEKKTAQTKAQEAEEKRLKAEEENARKNGDVAALEKSWGDKFTNRENELNSTIDGLNKQIYQLTVGQTAQALAAKLAVQGCSDVLLPHLTNRLSVETVDGQPKIRVKDLQGNPSAATLEDLEKEYRSDARFKTVIAASNASGGGANGAQGGGATKKPSEMNMNERAEWQKRDPQGFAKALESGEFNP